MEASNVRDSSVDMRDVRQLERTEGYELREVQRAEAGREAEERNGEPVPTPAVQLDVASPEATPEPVLTGAEAIICAYFPECEKALRVAVCESGPDYSAPYNGYHIGTWQLYAGHAWRFAERGWNYWADGLDVERNTVIAREVYDERGWQPWGYCSRQ